MKTVLTCLFFIILTLATGTMCRAAQDTHRTPPPEAEQVLFLIDNSSSMDERGFDPAEPFATRWEIARKVFPRWLERIESTVLVGAVSVGGACGSPPSIDLPVGSDRSRVAEVFNATSPNGATNLNAVLKNTPSYFSKGTQGKKRIILLSDGMNTCEPKESTCEIVRQLYKDHGIIVDVVAWVTDPQMISEFQCVAAATGGTFFAPATIREFIHIPLFPFNPWRYVLLVLGLLTLILASQILYRHSYHVLQWDSRRSVLGATLLFLVGALTLYLVLFAGAGLVSAALGAVLLAATLTMVRKGEGVAGTVGSGRSQRWDLMILPALLLGELLR